MPFSPLRAANDEPPQPLGLESAQGLIGCVMADATIFREVSHVRPGQFAEPFHGRLWAVIGELISTDRTADIHTIADRLADDPAFRDLGRDYLWNLFDKSGATTLARQHAESVVEAHTRRVGSALLAEASRSLLDAAGAPAATLIGQLRGDLERLEQDAAAVDGDLLDAHAAAVALVDALDEEAISGRERGAMTGLRCFDRRMRGLRPGWLVVIGGRPSMAKSGLMRAAAYGAAERNRDAAVLIFSLEMERREVAERALSAASHSAGDGIAYSEFGRLQPYERSQLRSLQAAMPRNVLIDDRSTLSVDDIRRRIWAVKAKRPVAGVFIDYLQLLQRPAAAGRNDALVLAEMTRGLKTLAREAETCVVLLSQLNRQVESRDDKRPQLADLRDSGSIEQDANAVLFPYREAYYVERAEPKDVASPEHRQWQDRLELCRRRMEVIAAKVRGGAIGTDPQTYFAEFDHVEDVRP
jgi:replicative DNA helicase